MATDPMEVYNEIERLGSARLARLVEELEPMSQSTISRLIRRLASQKMNMIHRVGYEWFPVLDLCSGAGTQLKHLTDLCSGAGTQLSQVKHSGTQLSQVKQNDVEEHSLENTPRGPRLGEDLLTIADAADGVGFGLGREEDLLTEASLPIGGSSGRQKDVDATAPLSLALRGAGSDNQHADKQEQEPESLEVRDMFSINNHPAVMRHIVLKVRKARSRHNRGEGAKWAQARAKDKFYQMKLVPKDRIEDMEYLADAISRSVAHGKWWEDEAMHVSEMTRLIPDWRHGYKKALWDLDMVGPIADEPAAEEVPETEPVAVPPTQPVTPTPTGEVGEKYHTNATNAGNAPDTPPTQPASPTQPDVTPATEPEPVGEPMDDWGKDCAYANAHPVVHEDTASRLAREQSPWRALQADALDKLNRDMAQAALEAAAVVEVPATPVPAVEAIQEPVVDKDVIPADLPLDERVYMCVDRGMSSPNEICQKIAEDRPNVLRSLSRQTSVGKLREFTETNGQTGWKVVPGRAARSLRCRL